MVRCNLCGKEDLKFVFKQSDMMHEVDGSYDVWKCQSCGLFFINPQPGDKKLSEHYPSEGYYSLQGRKKTSFVEELLIRIFYFESNFFQRLLLLPLRPLLRSMPKIKDANFLDVGCGSGHFLSLVKSLGMKPYGVEPGSFSEEYAKKQEIDIFHGNLHEADYPEDFFDVITVNHVFEHVRSPRKMIKELRRILKPGGILIIAVPLTDSLARWIFGRCWVQFDVPRHLFSFSSRNIKTYGKKAGLKYTWVRYNSAPIQFTGSFFCLLNSFRRKKRYLVESRLTKNKFIFLLLWPFCLICNFLRVGDQAEFFFTK